MRPVIFGLGLSLAMAASAQAQPPRSVEYFIMHNAERQQTTRRCASLPPTAECLAAFKAGEYIQLAQAKQRANDGRYGAGSNDSPLYYDQFPIARTMTLHECDHPTGLAYGPSPQACQAARISAGK